MKIKTSLTIGIFFLSFIFNVSAQTIGWETRGIGTTSNGLENRIKSEYSSSHSLSILKKRPISLRVNFLEVNKIVRKNLPDFESLLTKQLLDNDFTLDNSAQNELVLDVHTFRSEKLISFNIRLWVQGYSFFQTNNVFSKDKWEGDELIDTIFWECTQFGFVKFNETDKIEDYTNECANSFIERINTNH